MENKLVVSPDMEPSLWARYLNAYTALIKERGYSPASVRNHVQLLKRFSKWLRKGRTKICVLDEIVVERFLRCVHGASPKRRDDAATLYRLLHLLRDQGATWPAKKLPLSPRQRLIGNYGRYLLEERERYVNRRALLCRLSEGCKLPLVREPGSELIGGRGG
jgi:Phage integrase, N-terminal SAM-like domain